MSVRRLERTHVELLQQRRYLSEHARLREAVVSNKLEIHQRVSCALGRCGGVIGKVAEHLEELNSVGHPLVALASYFSPINPDGDGGRCDDRSDRAEGLSPGRARRRIQGKEVVDLRQPEHAEGKHQRDCDRKERPIEIHIEHAATIPLIVSKALNSGSLHV